MMDSKYCPPNKSPGKTLKDVLGKSPPNPAKLAKKLGPFQKEKK